MLHSHWSRATPVIVPSGPSHTTNAMAFLDFLEAAANDPRWSGDGMMPEIERNFDLALDEKLMYRFAIIPIALFVAILRYHLWDVDRLVNKAMVYSALTGVLGLVYVVSALVVGYIVPGRLFNQGELVVVWIIAAALLFRPVRRRS